MVWPSGPPEGDVPDNCVAVELVELEEVVVGSDDVELGGDFTELGICVETEVTVVVDTVPGADTVVVSGSGPSKV